jgi:hypothetical protein
MPALCAAPNSHHFTDLNKMVGRGITAVFAGQHSSIVVLAISIPSSDQSSFISYLTIPGASPPALSGYKPVSDGAIEFFDISVYALEICFGFGHFLKNGYYLPLPLRANHPFRSISSRNSSAR